MSDTTREAAVALAGAHRPSLIRFDAARGLGTQRVDVQKATPEPGVRFGRLLVQQEVRPYFWRGRVAHRQWRCACDCGAETIVRADRLRCGAIVSCGCFRTEIGTKRLRRHGARGQQRRPPEYEAWQSVLHGKHAAPVCPRWTASGGRGFLNFLEDVGPRPSPRYRLIRVVAAAGFSAANCQWSDSVWREGVPRRFIRVGYKVLTLREAALESGVPYAVLCKRLQRQWPVERALLPCLG